MEDNASSRPPGSSSPLRANPLLTSLLRDVSRSFYLTVRVLPAAIRPQIALAYLLARTTDTIADTELVSLELRLAALKALRERILGQNTAPLDFGEMAKHQGSSAERVLLERTEESLSLLQSLTRADLGRIREVLDIITGGQELDLRRFAGASAERIIALSSDADLDDYAYRVAGCVGEFWTRMCRAHLFPRARLDDTALLANAVRFGKGLQLVNILRDLPVDLRHGRCYLPSSQLESLGLKPEALLLPQNLDRLRPLYNQWLDRTEAHLHAGWDYTNSLPRTQARVRLACAWPILIGLGTIARLRSENVLDPQIRIKISRRELKLMTLRSIVYYPWQPAWRNLVRKRPLSQATA